MIVHQKTMKKNKKKLERKCEKMNGRLKLLCLLHAQAIILRFVSAIIYTLSRELEKKKKKKEKPSTSIYFHTMWKSL